MRLPPKLDRESPDAYARFCLYVVPPEGEARTFRSVARQLDLAPDTIREQAERYEWRSRCTAWERHRVEAAALKAGTLAAEAGRDALALCRALRDQVAAIVAAQEDETDAGVILQGARDAAWVLDKLVKTERLVLGLSTQNQAVVIDDKRESKLNMDALSDAELTLHIAYSQLLLKYDHGNERASLPHLERVVTLIEAAP